MDKLAMYVDHHTPFNELGQAVAKLVNDRLRKRVTAGYIIINRYKFPLLRGIPMNRKFTRRNNSFWTGFTAALAAGTVASGVMLFLNLSIGGVSLPEVFGSELTALMPPPLFN